jgi:membrane protein implicated in regulation of membrane protease activity
MCGEGIMSTLLWFILGIFITAFTSIFFYFFPKWFILGVFLTICISIVTYFVSRKKDKETQDKTDKEIDEVEDRVEGMQKDIKEMQDSK